MKRKYLVWGLITALAAGLLLVLVIWRSIFGPATAFTGEKVVLEIRTGSTFADLRDQLVREQIIRSASDFAWACRLKRFHNAVKPGRYIITRGTSLNRLINRIRSGAQDPVMLKIPPCRTLAHLSGALSKQLEPDSAQFANYLYDPALADSLGLTTATLPSLLLSDSYECWWNTSPASFIERMQREWADYWTEENKTKAAARGLSPLEVNILASIVQGETARQDEAPVIAGLYLNRLKKGKRLQADPTVAFALGRDIPRLTFSDYDFISPYNTYLIDGLPPGPIALVSTIYLDAVLNAAEHTYIYMCARPDLSGYHNFTASYEQHLQNANAYRRAINSR